jgi:hypothetical protein
VIADSGKIGDVADAIGNRAAYRVIAGLGILQPVEARLDVVVGFVGNCGVAELCGNGHAADFGYGLAGGVAQLAARDRLGVGDHGGLRVSAGVDGRLVDHLGLEIVDLGILGGEGLVVSLDGVGEGGFGRGGLVLQLRDRGRDCIRVREMTGSAGWSSVIGAAA